MPDVHHYRSPNAEFLRGPYIDAEAINRTGCRTESAGNGP